jgi:carbon-monoxide dehydrogenase small subunit
MKYPVALTVNGREHSREVEARMLLVDFLRDDLGLTGVHAGCESGVCGACTVIADGLALKSCTRFAVQADGSSILTIEGLAAEAALAGTATVSGLHPLQEAFRDAGAVHCGFCTPGMVLAAKGLLADCPRPSVEEVRAALDGNLCRCTGHQQIIAAVLGAAVAAPGPPRRDAQEP